MPAQLAYGIGNQRGQCRGIRTRLRFEEQHARSGFHPRSAQRRPVPAGVRRSQIIDAGGSVEHDELPGLCEATGQVAGVTDVVILDSQPFP
jgi:hypothetical protein